MRFSLPSIRALVIIGIAIYVIQLGTSNDLDLYIHPRYIVFTVALSVVGGLIGIFGPRKNYSLKLPSLNRSVLGMLPLVVVLTAAFILPASSLSSATVSQRSVEGTSPVLSETSQPLSNLFAGSSKGLGLADWNRLLQANPDPSYYVSKPAKISGFIYDAGLGSNVVWLGRFVATCCAVDAQPIGVAVEIEGWQDQFEQDQWLEVEGEFKQIDTSDGEQLVLIPTSVQTIDEPENPYAN